MNFASDLNFSKANKQRIVADASCSDSVSDSGVAVKARLSRVDMQLLDKLVEGLGHLGIVTTTNKALGEVMILSTKDCWPELKKAIEKMPFELEWQSFDLQQNDNKGEV
jgi:hypothetical protein